MFNKSNSELTDDKIWSIAVDKKGNKWLGTSNSGIVKYNGGTFSVFNKSNSLVIGEQVSPIFVDSKNNIWISFSNPEGLVKYDGEKWISFSSEEIKLSKLSIIDIAEDKAGNLYFGGASGLTKFDGNKWQKVPLPKGKNYTIRAIDINSNNTIAVGHNKGLLIQKDDKWTSFTERNSELQSYVRSLKYVGNDLYIGYGGNLKGGFSKVRNDEWTHINKENSDLPDNMIRDIEIDAKGNFWMASNNGLIKISKNKITPIHFRNKGDAILDITIEGNVVWVATLFGFFELDKMSDIKE
ncbi:two-component regulator propeller domain-containing protein [Polaribacter cellanae]|uniref:Two component regulator propeller n=1 Tax=Polaribacter cellanae TaxID=2818493 RepID=A0A975CLZ4_9FLAO|nr:two-component regulator propeller domain-containing protein [Polaribacter cellanae]QTE21054.1 hypothetical protein J3359_09350 [Polaribacter cellanae]